MKQIAVVNNIFVIVMLKLFTIGKVNRKRSISFNMRQLQLMILFGKLGEKL